MDRTNATPDEILAAVVARLRSELSLDEGSCYLATDPQAKSRRVGDLTFIVTPTGGTFDEAMFDGGGVEQLTTHWGFEVTIQSALLIDEAQREAKFLSDAANGVLIAATKVLKALLKDWEPQDATVVGEERLFLRDQLSPADFNFSKMKTTGSMMLSFKCVFDWNLA